MPSFNATTINPKYVPILITIASCFIALIIGLAAGVDPLVAALLSIGIIGSILCFRFFDYFILTLLVSRSTIDTFSSIQLPSLFAIGLDALAIGYVITRVLRRETIKADPFLFFFAGWCAFQATWVLVLALGGLGGGAYLLGESIREFARIASWFLVYVLIMQFRDRISPEKLINVLLLALVVPLTVATLQMIFPDSLPDVLSPFVKSLRGPGAEGVGLRIRGTIAHPNAFSTFLFFFIGLAYWKALVTRSRRLLWSSLLLLLVFFYITTKALFSLGMLAIFIIGMSARKFSVLKVALGIFLFALILALFGLSDFGQERLASIAQTPLLNPDIDVSRAIVLSKYDFNSFNWRVAQWTEMLTKWARHPWLGYGIGVSGSIASNGSDPHNDYIRWLVEQGWVGAAGIGVFFTAQFYRLFSLARSNTSTSKQKNLCYVMAIMLVAVMFGMITENIWTHTMLFFYWWTLFAIAGWDWRDKQITQQL